MTALAERWTAEHGHPKRELRCEKCGTLIAKVTTGAIIIESICRKCKELNLWNLSASG